MLRRGPGVGVGLRRHRGFDVLPQGDPLDGVGFQSLIQRGDRRPGRHRGRPAVAVDGDEDHQALGRRGERADLRIRGGDGDLDVHAGPSGVHHPGVHLDQVPGLDRAGEVDVADVGRHAIVAAPPDSQRVGGLVDPFQDPAAVHRTAEERDVGGCSQEPQGEFALSGSHCGNPRARGSMAPHDRPVDRVGHWPTSASASTFARPRETPDRTRRSTVSCAVTAADSPSVSSSGRRDESLMQQRILPAR